MDERNRKKLTDAGNVLMVARWEGSRGDGANREGTEKSKLVVTKQSWDVKYIIKNSRR